VSKTPDAVEEYLRASQAVQKPATGAVDPVAEYLQASGQSAPAANPDEMSDLERQVLGLPPKMSKLEALNVAVGQGVAPFADEFAAASRAGFGMLTGKNPLDTYKTEVEKIRAQQGDATGQHPKTAIAGNLLGGAATAIASGGGSLLPKAATLGGRMLVGGAQGAGSGALYGAGNADGSIGDRLKGGVEGGGWGGLFGTLIPTVPAIARGLADLIPGIRSDTSSAAAGAAARPGLGPLATNRAGAVGIKPTLNPISTLDERAADDILRKLDQGKLTVDQISAKLAGRTGKPENLMDVGGQPIQKLGRAARTASPEAAMTIDNALHGRAAGAEERVLDDLLGTTKTPRENQRKVIEKLADERGVEADKLYGKVYDVPVEKPELGAFLQDPAFKNAYERARRIAAREKDPMPALDDILTDEGQLITPLTVRQLDRIKRGLDDVLEGAQKSPLESGGLGNEEMAGLRRLKNEYLAAIDEAVPDYKVARDAFGGRSAVIKAHDKAKKLFSTDPDELGAMVEDMSAAEREAFRKGGHAALAARIEGIKPGHDIARTVADKTLDRKRVRYLFDDDESYEAFRGLLSREAQMHQTKTFVQGGSNTADKMMELVDLFEIGLTGNPLNMLQRLGIKAAGRAMTERKANAVATKLTATNFPDLLKELAAAQKRQTDRAGRHGRYSRTAGVQAGLSTGKDR
jgi:hypothetical protein